MIKFESLTVNSPERKRTKWTYKFGSAMRKLHKARKILAVNNTLKNKNVAVANIAINRMNEVIRGKAVKAHVAHKVAKDKHHVKFMLAEHKMNKVAKVHKAAKFAQAKKALHHGVKAGVSKVKEIKHTVMHKVYKAGKAIKAKVAGVKKASHTKVTGVKKAVHAKVTGVKKAVKAKVSGAKAKFAKAKKAVKAKVTKAKFISKMFDKKK